MDPAEALRILEEERRRGVDLVSRAGSIRDLEAARTSALGRRSAWSEVQRSLGSMSETDRRRVGRAANETRADLEATLAARLAELEAVAEMALIDADRADLSL